MGDSDINPSSQLGDGNMCRLSFRPGVGSAADLGPDLGLAGDSTRTCPGQRHRQRRAYSSVSGVTAPALGLLSQGEKQLLRSWLGTDSMPLSERQF